MTFLLDRQVHTGRTGKIIILGILIAFSTVLQIVENLVFPSSLPVRLGIANLVTLIVLFFFGMGEAILVTSARCILAALLSGKFLAPPFILSIAGGLAATLIMGVLLDKNDKLGPVGVSVIGAVIHSFTQLLVVYLLFIPNGGILYLVPWVWLTALVSGLVIGFLFRKAVSLPLLKKLGAWKKESREAR